MSPRSFDLKAPPAIILKEIQALFRDLGLLGERLTLTHQGRRCQSCCDAEAFTV